MNEAGRLLEGYFENELTLEEELQLREWLAQDVDHMRAFVREAHLHYDLQREAAARQIRLALELAAPEGEELGHQNETSESVEVSETPSLLFTTRESTRGLWRRGSLLALAASIAILAGIVFWLFPRADDNATLAFTAEGAVSIGRGAQTFVGADGIKLQAGDVLVVRGTNSVSVRYASESTRIDLHPGTDLRLADHAHGKGFELRTGKIEASVARQRPFRPMVVVTSQAVVRVLGTHFTLAADTEATRLDVTEGRVLLNRASDGAGIRVTAGAYAVAAANTQLAALPMTGRVLRESWNGVSWQIPSDSISDPRFPLRPDASDLVNRFEVEPITTNHFGLRFRGFVHPPATGEYEFWLAGSRAAQLSLSPDEHAAHKVPVASTYNQLAPREWDGKREGASQRSGTIRLEAGKRYYIEAIMVVPSGQGHLSVAWKRPNALRESLSCDFLSPADPRK